MNDKASPRKPNPLYRIAETVVCLWRTRDELRIKNVRPDHLMYFFPMVIVLTLLDQRNTYFHETAYNNFWIGHVSNLNYGAFCLGSLIVLLFFLKDMRLTPRILSLVALMGLLLWFFVPDPLIRPAFIILSQFGLGGCAIYAMYAYVFVLCNAERLFAILVVTLNYGMFVNLKFHNISNIFFSVIIPLVLMVMLVACMFSFRQDKFPEDNHDRFVWPPAGIYVVLACPFAFFVNNIFGEAIVGGGNGFGMRGTGAILAVLVSVVIQLVFRRSVWHMLNLFLVLVIIGIALMSIPLPDSSFNAGALIFGMGDGIGYIMTFYLTGILKKYRNIVFFKRITLATVIILITAISATELMTRYWQDIIPVTAAMVAAFFLCAFLLLSPILHRNVFNEEWMDDSRSADVKEIMQELDEKFPQHNPHTPDLFSEFIQQVKTLTPTEKTIFNYCIEEKSNKDILSLMYISMSTLKTHYSHIYSKLNVSSRDELSLYIQLIKKSDRLSDIM